MEIMRMEALKPGSRLARPVFTAEGALLFSPGETLDKAKLAVLKQHGIRSVAVIAANAEAGGGARPSDVMLTLRETEAARFCRNDLSVPQIKIIFDRAIERQSRLLLSKAGKIRQARAEAPAYRTERPPKVSIHSLLEAGHRIGTPPTVFHRLVEMIDDPDVTADALSTVIASDTALTARLLRLVNSPFYGLDYKIDNISRAVVIVGTRQLVLLAMGAILVTRFKGIPVNLVNMRSFWSHSLSCGAAARILARHTGTPQPESYFVAGLLHDVARLLIYTSLPKHALYILTEARRRQESVTVLEKEVLGFSHDELGEKLIQTWACPPELALRVGRHHLPLTEKDSAEELLLPAANMLSQALGHGASGESVIPALPAWVWERLDLSPDALPGQCERLDETMRSLRSFFE
ncbi:MAG: HDOD domain-containing protein [Desulfovibrio sp.]|jgi:HD-like signal output (HDOD) protein|nr:HDOD domain-containing protein [Desulfovibrio sp.]